MATRTDNNEIRALDEREIDAVSGGAGNYYNLGFGISLYTDGKCWSVGYNPGTDKPAVTVTTCPK